MRKHDDSHPSTTTATTDAPLEITLESPTDATIELWFRETFHNRAIDNDEINRLTAAKDRLKALVRGSRS
jgi:hypothetical protein